MQRGQDGYLERIDRQGAGRDLAHAAIDKVSELHEVFGVAVRADVISLVVDFNSDGGCGCRSGFHTAFTKNWDGSSGHLSSSAISGSSAATASSMASTFERMMSRSARSDSTCFSRRCCSKGTLPRLRRIRESSFSRLSFSWRSVLVSSIVR